MVERSKVEKSSSVLGISNPRMIEMNHKQLNPVGGGHWVVLITAL